MFIESSAEFIHKQPMLILSAGAAISGDEVLSTADAVLCSAFNASQMALLKGCSDSGFMSPVTAIDSIDAAAAAGVTAFSLELVPRISRAQSMDTFMQALCANIAQR